jgi:uncharacterized membrane protein
MAKKQSSAKDDVKKDWERDIDILKILMILLVNKMGVEQKDIAKSLGISEGRLSKILNPKKYKKKRNQ